ncbi:hypothetical protein FIV46_01225 [Emcibacter nanhaiensis]|uniref:Uncharacterized protein n=1 Tax=Emcibacter nanhaiensis TaxID=1505037 RepID=A0A501PRE4_9PROT|nr:hypothetical protein FIV46_01225 [Emcibacter nanhaiensis]
MARYYVNENAQSGGEHEVHRGDCSWLPKRENRIYLGDFSSCHPAISAARAHFLNVDGCAHCCPACHTK